MDFFNITFFCLFFFHKHSMAFFIVLFHNVTFHDSGPVTTPSSLSHLHS